MSAAGLALAALMLGGVVVGVASSRRDPPKPRPKPLLARDDLQKKEVVTNPKHMPQGTAFFGDGTSLKWWVERDDDTDRLVGVTEVPPTPLGPGPLIREFRSLPVDPDFGDEAAQVAEARARAVELAELQDPHILIDLLPVLTRHFDDWRLLTFGIEDSFASVLHKSGAGFSVRAVGGDADSSQLAALDVLAVRPPPTFPDHPGTSIRRVGPVYRATVRGANFRLLDGTSPILYDQAPESQVWVVELERDFERLDDAVSFVEAGLLVAYDPPDASELLEPRPEAGLIQFPRPPSSVGGGHFSCSNAHYAVWNPAKMVACAREPRPLELYVNDVGRWSVGYMLIAAGERVVLAIRESVYEAAQRTRERAGELAEGRADFSTPNRVFTFRELGS